MEATAKILVVDDDWRNRDLMSAFLEPLGLDVLMAENGPAALKACLLEKPDLVLLDVMMPGMDGFEVARRLRGNPETFELPVVMVTALNQVGDRVAALEAGADDFLTKPVDRTELKARVLSLLKIKVYRDQINLNQARVAQELALASNLQKGLLPRRENLARLARRHGLAISYGVRPAGEVCGDFLDVQRLEQGVVAVTLADCKGHGVSAGMMTMAVHALLHSLPDLGAQAGENLTLLAKNLSGVLPSRQFAAAAHFIYDPRSAVLSLARAGLPGPIFGHADPQSIREPGVAGAPPLGLVKGNTPIGQREFQMAEGDRLVLYTDGFSEAEEKNGGFFGIPSQKLLTLCRRHWELPLEEFKSALLTEWEQRQGAGERDDCSLVVVERLAG